MSMAQLAIAWCMKNPHVSSVITGASKPQQVLENMQVVGFVDRLSADVMDRIEKILENKPQPLSDYR
jgi:aryl-alcohol dehydrogenase-like predicted oxidoreductase